MTIILHLQSHVPPLGWQDFWMGHVSSLRAIIIFRSAPYGFPSALHGAHSIFLLPLYCLGRSLDVGIYFLGVVLAALIANQRRNLFNVS